VLAEPRPADDLQFTLGTWHWARGLAYLRQGQLPQAEAEAAQLAAIARSTAVQEAPLFSRTTAGTLLDLAWNVLAGELAGARGQSTEQIAHLQHAVAMQDSLPYMEPPSWYYPVRQDLGAALLQQGRAAEAEAVYREDLRQYPNNGWSLFGLAQSLRAQGREAEAAEAQRRFEAAWQHADVTLSGSGF
jgi:tetratricopeptide (TPR) repeat protein